MEIIIKVAPRDYNRLRSQVPASSVARDAINKATPIDHSLDGVQFAGYTIPCNEEQARIVLETAKQCCPDIVPNIEEAIKLARHGA
jgi:hypothetical protein